MWDEHGSNENPYKLTEFQANVIAGVGAALFFIGMPVLLVWLLMSGD